MPDSDDQLALWSQTADPCPPIREPGPKGTRPARPPREAPGLLPQEEEAIRDGLDCLSRSGDCSILTDRDGRLRVWAREALTRHLRFTRQGTLFDPADTMETVLRRLAEVRSLGDTST